MLAWALLLLLPAQIALQHCTAWIPAAWWRCWTALMQPGRAEQLHAGERKVAQLEETRQVSHATHQAPAAAAAGGPLASVGPMAACAEEQAAGSARGSTLLAAPPLPGSWHPVLYRSGGVQHLTFAAKVLPCLGTDNESGHWALQHHVVAAARKLAAAGCCTLQQATAVSFPGCRRFIVQLRCSQAGAAGASAGGMAQGAMAVQAAGAARHETAPGGGAQPAATAEQVQALLPSGNTVVEAFVTPAPTLQVVPYPVALHMPAAHPGSSGGSSGSGAGGCRGGDCGSASTPTPAAAPWHTSPLLLTLVGAAQHGLTGWRHAPPATPGGVVQADTAAQRDQGYGSSSGQQDGACCVRPRALRVVVCAPGSMQPLLDRTWSPAQLQELLVDEAGNLQLLVGSLDATRLWALGHRTPSMLLVTVLEQDSSPQRSGPQRSGPQHSGPRHSGPHRSGTEVPPQALHQVDRWLDTVPVLLLASTECCAEVSKLFTSMVAASRGNKARAHKDHFLGFAMDLALVLSQPGAASGPPGAASGQQPQDAGQCPQELCRHLAHFTHLQGMHACCRLVGQALQQWDEVRPLPGAVLAAVDPSADGRPGRGQPLPVVNQAMAAAAPASAAASGSPESSMQEVPAAGNGAAGAAATAAAAVEGAAAAAGGGGSPAGMQHAPAGATAPAAEDTTGGTHSQGSGRCQPARGAADGAGDPRCEAAAGGGSGQAKQPAQQVGRGETHSGSVRAPKVQLAAGSVAPRVAQPPLPPLCALQTLPATQLASAAALQVEVLPGRSHSAPASAHGERRGADGGNPPCAGQHGDAVDVVLAAAGTSQAAATAGRVRAGSPDTLCSAPSAGCVSCAEPAPAAGGQPDLAAVGREGASVSGGKPRVPPQLRTGWRSLVCGFHGPMEFQYQRWKSATLRQQDGWVALILSLALATDVWQVLRLLLLLHSRHGGEREAQLTVAAVKACVTGVAAAALLVWLSGSWRRMGRLRRWRGALVCASQMVQAAVFALSCLHPALQAARQERMKSVYSHVSLLLFRHVAFVLLGCMDVPAAAVYCFLPMIIQQLLQVAGAWPGSYGWQLPWTWAEAAVHGALNTLSFMLAAHLELHMQRAFVERQPRLPAARALS